MELPPCYIGCAGWSLSSAVADAFPGDGSHLERYARVLTGVEINTSFYRPHQPKTYARWRDSVPEDFRFSVKVPRTITHIARLRDTDALLARFLGEAGELGHKLGCLLVQLPPSLAFDHVAAHAFFEGLRAATTAPVACEPRHITWFSPAARRTLAECAVGYVDADPRAVALQDMPPPGDLAYIRLHGSPEMYHSAYSERALARVAHDVAAHRAHGRTVWVVFDNTASGAAQPNALSLLARVSGAGDDPISG